MKGPFIKSDNKTSSMMKNLLFALIPIILFSFYKNGIVPYQKIHTSFYELIYPLLFVFVGGLSSFLIEMIYVRFILKKKHDQFISYMKDSYSIFPGIFLSLILPIHTPIIILIFGCFIAIVLGKMLYGGFGHNIFNPALVGGLFVLTAYSSLITSQGGYLNSYEMDAIAGATPLSQVVEGLGSYDSLVKPYGSLFNFFLGTIPGAIGETSSILCIFAFFYLSYKKVIKWKIPVFYVGTVFVMTLFIALFNNLGIWYPIFQVLSGGLLFGSVFMATDPVTSPVTNLGQILYGICLGILTTVCRFLTPYPEGVLTSILFMNMMVFLLDKIGIRNCSFKRKQVISLCIVIILSIGIASFVGIKNKTTEIKDNDFKIVSKTEKNNQVIYIATQKGFKGNIKAEVVVERGNIKKYTILEIEDDYYPTVEKENYIEKLLDSQKDLENVDTVSGATRTSTALKKLLMNIRNEHDSK